MAVQRPEADELIAQEQIRQLAMQASAKILARLAEKLRYTPMATPRSADDLEDAIDTLVFSISDLNNWKGVLTWLDGKE